MKGVTHIAAGTVAGMALGYSLQLPLPGIAVTTLTSMVAATIPDIDTHTSKAGKKLGIGSWLIQHIVGHRTLFHAPILYLALAILAYRMYPTAAVGILATLCGILSHLLLDLLNPMGIPLLYPFPKRYRLARFRSGGTADEILRKLLIVIAVVFAIYLLLNAKF